ncbi:MAG: PH domain-containing protein [Acidimicrobiaceae bacterium]|nr:PH domain-containing protein [Acidimicrobiaceae bacterium]
MSFPRKQLRPGEEVVLDVRPQGWVLVPRALLAVVVLAGAVAARVAGVSTVVAWLLVALLAVTLGWLLVGYLRWITTSFVLTTDRLVHRSGILSRNSREIPLDQLSDISYRQSLLERVVAIGDIVLESAGRESAETFTGLPHPARIQREIHRQLELGRMRVAGAAAGSPGYPGPSIPEQIEQLAELARRGVLTESEFQAKKAELLDRL